MFTYLRDDAFGQTRPEPGTFSDIRQTLGFGPIPYGHEWRGGRQYTCRYEDDYVFNGTYIWTKYIGWHYQLVLYARKWRRGYAWDLRIQSTKNGDLRSEIFDRGRARNLREIFDKADSRALHFDIYMRELMRRAFDPAGAVCVYQYDRVQDAWVPFCTHFPLQGQFTGDHSLLGHTRPHVPYGHYLLVRPLGPAYNERRIARATYYDIGGWGYSSSNQPNRDIPPLVWWCYDVEPRTEPYPSATWRPQLYRY